MANTAILSWADSLNFKKIEIPAGSGAMAPNLSLMGDHFALSWINRSEGQKSRFFLTEWNGSGFEIKNLIAASEKMFSNS